MADAGVADASPMDAALPKAPRALHISGSDDFGGGGWGATVDANLLPTGLCYDATKYTGVSVWLKGAAGSQISVRIRTAAVHASNFTTGPYVKVITLTADWQEYKIPFTGMDGFGPGYGAAIPFDVTQLDGIGVQAVQPSPPAGRPDGGAPAATDAAAARWTFDYWVDNIGFY